MGNARTATAAATPAASPSASALASTSASASARVRRSRKVLEMLSSGAAFEPGAALELPDQRCQRLGTVTLRVLQRRRQLGHGHLVALGYEQRVITKPAAARAAGRDPAFPAAAGRKWRAIAGSAHQHQYTTIARLASFQGHAVKFC